MCVFLSRKSMAIQINGIQNTSLTVWSDFAAVMSVGGIRGFLFDFPVAAC